MRQQSKIGVEVRAEPQAAPRLHAARHVEPRSGLGRYLVRHWERVSLVGGESLVYWLKKLIFRSAWLDHRVKEGILDVAWDEQQADFAYRDPNGDRALLELAPVPSWHDRQFRR